MRQESNQCVSDFISNLTLAIQDCGYKEIKADNFEHAMLVQQLIVGLRDEKARENLLSEKKDLSWEKACDIASPRERVRQNLQQLNQSNDGVIASLESEMAVSLVNTAVSSPRQRPSAPSKQPPSCYRCGQHHIRWSDCRHQKTVCQFCKKVGHIERVCFSKRRANTHTHSTYPNPAGNGEAILRMFSANTPLKSPYTITLRVDRHPVKFEIDTGSAVTLINEASLQKLPSHLRASSTFHSYTGQNEEIRGVFTAEGEHDGELHYLPVHVAALADIPLFTMSCELDLSSDFNPHLERFSFPVNELAELPGPAICCPGKLKFRLMFDGEREDRGCRVFEMGEVRRLFVNLNKPFILDVTFCIPFTPMNLAIRLIPQFVSPQRWCDPVLRCANHTEASGPEADVIKRRSFLTVSSPDTTYSFTGPKLRGDHLNLCIPINKLRSAARGVKEEYGVSNSQDNLPLVIESITCRLHCFSSCFGPEDRGRIELVARLEDLTGQIDGVAMGSPLGPFLANVFMGKVEMTSLQDTINDLSFYGRYVDDIFCLTDVTTDTDVLNQKFNNSHPSLTFSAAFEANNEIAFLDVLLHRQEDGSIQRRVFRKKTWTGQYINFHSFVPLNIKRNLVQGLAARVRRICSPETVEAELQKLRDTLHENGYPERFILRNIGECTAKPTMATAEKKDLFIRLPFQGDAASELVKRRLKTAITSAFPAANLRVCFTNSPLLRLGGKDQLPLQATSMCIYSFTCSCGAGYIGRTTRRLEKRVREHIPAWLGKGEKKSISSSILAHLVDTNHRVDAKEAFQIVYRTPAGFSKGLRQRVLATAEAVAIRLPNPVLCCQKTLTQALCLPWPTPTPTSLQPPDARVGAQGTRRTHSLCPPSSSPPEPNYQDTPTTP
nr:unnamed protein product [Spirometra erinaceieuropaei]